jgi:hypothetical protein
MPERRKSIRYPVRLRVYFPDQQVWGYTTNVSLDGCYVSVEINDFLGEGHIADMYLELPVVGTIALKGYVQHTEGAGEDASGMGVQFVQVRFAEDQSEYFGVYARFLRLMPKLEEIRAVYLDAVQQGKLKVCTFPEPAKDPARRGSGNG